MIEIESIQTELTDKHYEIISELEAQCFNNAEYPIEKIKFELESKKDVLVNFAKLNGEYVGFKLGYQKKQGTFYSWLGGVALSARGNGIARKLMDEQHKILKKNKYHFVTTQTANEFKAMLILNLKFGFDIIGTHVNSRNQLRITLSKTL